MNTKALLKDKNVLYVVLFFAVTNLIGYLLIRDLDAVVFMVIVGFLTSYFSKNMIIILLVAVLSTNCLIATKRWGTSQASVVEGHTGLRNRNNVRRRNNKKSLGNASTVQKPEVDYATTLEKAYDNLDKLLDSDALQQMSDDSQRLAGKQKKLMENIKSMEPMMQKAGSMLEGLDMDKIGGMAEKLTGIMGKLGGK